MQFILMYILYDGNKSGFDLFHVRIYMSEKPSLQFSGTYESFSDTLRDNILQSTQTNLSWNFLNMQQKKKNVQKLIYYNNTKCSQTVNKVLKDEELSTNAKDKLKH